MKHPVLRLASCLVIVGAVGAGIGAVTGNLWQTPTRLVAVSGQVRIPHRTRTVDVEVFDTNVTVSGTTGNALTYAGRLPVLQEKTASGARQVMNSEWTVSVGGDSVLMQLKKLPSQRRGLAISWRSPHLTISLPRHLAVKISTTNGTVRLQGIDASSTIDTTNSPVTTSAVQGPLHVHTSDGNVSLRAVTGSVAVTDQNGGVTLTNVHGSVDVQTSTSPVSLTNLLGSVNVADTSGAITAASPIGGRWTLKTTESPIRLSVPRATNALMTALTSQGSIGGTLHWIPEGPNSARSRTGTGIHRVRLQTTSANITVDRAR